MSRREFIRYATLLGVAAGTAYAMAGMTAPAMAAGTLPFPAAEPGAKPGGRLRIGEMVARMDDPATYNWNEMGNQTRPILDYLTMVGADNVVRPMLLESWLPSADLKTWTLHVRNGVMWHNGEELHAEHVAWNIRRWSDPALGSSNLGLSTFAALTEFTGDKDAKGKPARRPLKNGVEVLDSRTVRLNLARPVLSVAEDCGEFPTLVVHPSFKAPFSRNPIGTGPYTLAELRVGDRCILKRVTKTTDGRDFRYWGGDVYLDEIHFYHYEQENQTAALASGSVDAVYEVSVEQIELAHDPGRSCSPSKPRRLCVAACRSTSSPSTTSGYDAPSSRPPTTRPSRLVFGEHGWSRTTFTSPRSSGILSPAAGGARRRRREAALKEAGYDTGIDLNIVVGNNDGPWQQAACEALRDQLKEAGIRLAVTVVPATKFWEIWTKVPFGATSWAHRPLGTMALAQAYRSGASWNESHFSNPEFDKALADAEATLDVGLRKAKMQKVEKILQGAAVVVQPFWRPVFILASGKVHGYKAHPARQMQLYKVWMS
jgi:peptide/nickel transport system substrate-binding protein